MSEKSPATSVAEHLASSLTPRGRTVHWSNAKKIEIVGAILQGIISVQEAKRRYGLSDALI